MLIIPILNIIKIFLKLLNQRYFYLPFFSKNSLSLSVLKIYLKEIISINKMANILSMQSHLLSVLIGKIFNKK